MFQKSIGAGLLFATLLLAGCGPEGAEDNRTYASVSGTVTVDGKDLEASGLQIEFHPVDGTPLVALPISGGGFSGDVVAGENSIFITPATGSGAGHGADAQAAGGVNPALLRYSPGEKKPIKVNIPAEGKSGLKVEVGATPSAS